MSTATKSKSASKAKPSSRPAAKTGAANYGWQLPNEAEIKKTLSPFQFNGLTKAITVLHGAGIKVQPAYKKIEMGKMKASQS